MNFFSPHPIIFLSFRNDVTGFNTVERAPVIVPMIPATGWVVDQVVSTPPEGAGTDPATVISVFFEILPAGQGNAP